MSEKLNKNPEKKTTQKIKSTHKKRKPIATPDKSRFIKFLKISVTVLLLLILAVGIGYYILSEKYSPDHIIGEVSQAIESEDTEALAEAVSNDMTENEADAYLKYIDSSIGKQKYITELAALDEVNETLADDQFILMELISEERVFFIFHKYGVEIPQYEVTIDSEIEDGEVTYQNGNQQVKWNTSRNTFDNMFPGVYNFEGTLRISENEFDSDIVVDFNEADDDGVKGDILIDAFYTEIEVGIFEPEFGIHSEDIAVYINNQNINLDFNEKGNAVYGPLNYDQSYQFRAEVDYEEQIFQTMDVEVNHSKKNEVADANYIVPLKFDQRSIRNHLDTLKAEEKSQREERILKGREKRKERLAAKREQEDEENEENESVILEKRAPDSSINTSIDVLSSEFINEYFSGPEAYTFEGIDKGMSQTEIEELLGLPDDYYEVEGGEFAIYDNAAILYSESFPDRDRNREFKYIDPDTNYVTRTEVLLNVPHNEIVSVYGEPTLSYDEYPDLGPSGRRTIYDGKRNNGYAVYIEVGYYGTAGLMIKDEELDNIDEYK